MALRHDKYLYIRAWGKKLGLAEPYTQRVLRQAVESNAPPNAICCPAGVWMTIEDVGNKEFRISLEKAVKKMKEELQSKQEAE